MPSQSDSLIIHAPRELIFNAILAPEHIPEIVQQSLVRVKTLKRLPDGGVEYLWVFNFAGLELETKNRTVELEPPQRIVVQATGVINALSTWTLEALKDKTRATLTIEYDLPDHSLLAKLSERYISQQIRFEINGVLRNLMELTEHLAQEGKA